LHHILLLILWRIASGALRNRYRFSFEFGGISQ